MNSFVAQVINEPFVQMLVLPLLQIRLILHSPEAKIKFKIFFKLFIYIIKDYFTNGTNLIES